MNDLRKDVMDDATLARLRGHAKRELRTRMRAVRRVLPRSACELRTSAATTRLLELPEFARARCVLGFHAIHKELDPAALLARAAELGKRVALPRVHDSGLSLHLYQPGDVLEESGFGTLDPSPDAPLVEPTEVDLVLVPGLAFDARGHRIGYGRAFYDRLLPTLLGAFRVGVAYDFQVLPELPNEEHDVPVHCVVSDARVLRM
jgi:5-formyltetrahydrofolate cyclo-ligase